MTLAIKRSRKSFEFKENREPLNVAHVQIIDEGNGNFRAVAHLRPWLQFEALTAALTMVTHLGPAVISAASALAGAGLQARFGRKVRLKIDGVEAEASSTAEVAELLEKAIEVRDRLKDGAG